MNKSTDHETAVQYAVRIVEGRASVDEAMLAASMVVHHLNTAVRSAAQADLDAIGYLDARALLNEIDEVRGLALRACLELASYPDARQLVEAALSVAAYAEATVTPALLLGNADAKKARVAATAKTYIIKHSDSGLYKIGKSIDVDSRIRSLATGAGGSLSLLAVINQDIERDLHKQFDALRVFGEWFRDDGRIEQYARQIREADKC